METSKSKNGGSHNDFAYSLEMATMTHSFLFFFLFFFFITIIFPLEGTGSCEACGTFTAPPLLMTHQTGDQSHPEGSQSSP